MSDSRIPPPVTAASVATAVNISGSSSGQLAIAVEPSRARQRPVPVSPFRDVLAGGVDLLLRGASVATGVVAGPVLAAAVRDAGQSVRTPGAAVGGGRSTAAPGGPAIAGAHQPLGSPTDQGDLAAMHAMQRESQVFNLQLLGLQEDVQQENRRFTTVSNVLRSKHDTAKAAVANIRS
jgi:hypothetical protein